MWKTCRAQEKALREMMSEQRKRAERRAAYFAQKFSDPVQGVRIIGQPAKIYHDTNQYNTNESMGTLMPWQGHTDNMIDRFDVRAMLDHIPVYDPKVARLQTDEDKELEADLNYCRYKDIVEHSRTGAQEIGVIKEVYDRIEDVILDAVAFKGGPPPPQEEKKQPALYSSVGFNYGTEDNNNDKEDDEEDDEGEEDDESEEEETYEEREKEVNNLAANEYGIPNFCRQIRLELKQGDANELKRPANVIPGQEKKGRRRSRRERRRDRDNNRDQPYRGSHVAYERRGSPTYDDYEDGRTRNRRDDSDKEEKIEFITEFNIGEGGEVDDNSSGINSMQESVYRAPVTTTTATATTKLKSEPPKTEVKKEPVIEKKLTPQERLKMKMRNALNKTIAQDMEETEKKRNEQEKEKQRKAEELRELRRKYERSVSRSRSRSRSHSRSRSRSRSPSRRSYRSRSRSRSSSRSRRSRHSRSRSPARNSKTKDTEKETDKEKEKGKEADRGRKRDREGASRSRSRSRSRSSGRRKDSRQRRSRTPPRSYRSKHSRSRSRDRDRDRNRSRSRDRGDKYRSSGRR